MKRWYYVVKEDGSAIVVLCKKKTAQQYAKHNLLYFPISAKNVAKTLAFILKEVEEKNS